MRPSLRFLALVTIGWAGVRAYTLGAIPAGSLSLIERSEAKSAPSIVPTEFPPIEPVQAGDLTPSAPYPDPYAPQAAPMMPLQIRPVAVPIYYGVNSVRVPLPPARPVEIRNALPEPRRPLYAQAAEADDWPFSRLAPIALGERRAAAGPLHTTPVLTASTAGRSAPGRSSATSRPAQSAQARLPAAVTSVAARPARA